MPLNERKDLMEKMVRFMVKWAAVLVTALSVGACDEGEEVYPEGDRTVLLYLAGDNNLSSYGYTNIKSLREGMKGVAGRVVVYFDPKGSVPCLMVVQGGSNPTIDTLEFYEEEDSASPETLRRVIVDTKRLFPSESYGLILWSHGTGWFPEHYSFPGAMSSRRADAPYIPTKWFGQDDTLPEGESGTYMEVEDLVEGITKASRGIGTLSCSMLVLWGRWKCFMPCGTKRITLWLPRRRLLLTASLTKLLLAISGEARRI